MQDRGREAADKWLHARDVFFSKAWNKTSTLSDGLALARGCTHEDARFLVSLFPEGPPQGRGIATSVFLQHDKDARSLCWGSMWGVQPQDHLLGRSAEMGYAWGQALFACHCLAAEERRVWLDRAVAQGKRDGHLFRGFLLWEHDGRAESALEAWKCAADLGSARAQVIIGVYGGCS